MWLRFGIVRAEHCEQVQLHGIVVAYYARQISKITETEVETETAATDGYAIQLDLDSVLAPLNTPASTIPSP